MNSEAAFYGSYACLDRELAGREGKQLDWRLKIAWISGMMTAIGIASPAETDAGIWVRVYHCARVPKKTLVGAEANASTMLQTAGVHVRWAESFSRERFCLHGAAARPKRRDGTVRIRRVLAAYRRCSQAPTPFEVSQNSFKNSSCVCLLERPADIIALADDKRLR